MATYDLAYPGAAIDAILNTAYYLQEAGYIFRGSASDYAGTPSKREWVIAPAGFTGLGLSSAVPKGSIGVCLYNGTAWVGKVINVLTLDSEPTRNSQNGVTSGGVAATLDEIAGGIMETFASLLFDDETAAGDLSTKLSYAVKFSVSDVYQTVTHLNILAATTSKAGLLSAADKVKIDSFLTNLRSLTFADTTASADQGTKITETLKATIGGVQEVIDSITLLAATSSKAGLLSASDKAYIDALPATLTSLSNSISGALALMQSLVGYYVCDTAAGTAAKSVTATGYSLTNGGCIRIKMNNANTADNVTLNINSTGAKALYYDGAQASSTNSWEAGEVLEVYYDGTQYQCASGGGGKFATGENVKDISITDEVTKNSTALITSGAVESATMDEIEAHPSTSSYERVGTRGSIYTDSTTRVTLKLPMPINIVKLTSFVSGYRGAVVQWNANDPNASLINKRGTLVQDSGWLSSNSTISVLDNANFVCVTISKTNNGTITIEEAIAAVVITYDALRPNNYFLTNERVSEVAITDQIEEDSGAILKSGAVYPLKQKVEEHTEILSNCYHSSSGGNTITKTITQDDLQNGNYSWQSNGVRITQKRDNLFETRGYYGLQLSVPYSSVSGTSIDRCTINFYDSNKNYLLAVDLGWTYFEGQNLTFNIDLTESRYSNVAYLGIYFGSNNVSITPSMVNTSDITFGFIRPSVYTTKAVDEEMLLPLAEKNAQFENILSNCFHEGGGQAETVHILNSDLANTNQSYVASTSRAALKQTALINVANKYKVVMTVPASAVSNNVDRCTMTLYDSNKSYLSSLDLGWRYFTNGNPVVIEIDLTDANYSAVAYVGIYFGTSSGNLNLTSIDCTNITFDVTNAEEYTTKAVDEEMLDDRLANVYPYDFFDRSINIVGHMGGGTFAGNVAPRNSMWSALIGAKMGMKFIEFDIVFTSDDVPVCTHDLTLLGEYRQFVRKDGATITTDIAIGSMTFSTLTSTYEYRGGYEGYRGVSTLEDVLIVARDYDMKPMVEIKNPSTEMTSLRYNIVLNLIEKYVGLRNAACVMFDVQNAINLRKLSKGVQLGISGSAASQVPTMIANAKAYNLICGMYINAITEQIVQTFQAAGIFLYAWTPDYDIMPMLKMGVNTMICNDTADPSFTGGHQDTYVTNKVDFSNITHNGTVTDGHLVLTSGQKATLTSAVTSWLNGIRMTLCIKGTCTIWVNGSTYNVSNDDFSDFLILLRQHDKSNVTVDINGPCEIATLTFETKSY